MFDPNTTGTAEHPAIETAPDSDKDMREAMGGMYAIADAARCAGAWAEDE